MIVDIIGAPQLSLLEARLLCSESGVRIGYLSKGPIRFQTFKPELQIYFGPVRVIYLNELDLLPKYVEGLHFKPIHHLLLVNASHSLLIEHGIKIHREGMVPFSADDLIASFGKTPMKWEEISVVKQHDFAQHIMADINRESILGKLQTCFYRIKQIDDRQKVQSLVYAYISGALRTLPQTVPYIDKILETPLCTKFIQAVQYAKTSNPDVAAQKFGIDRFELAFVLVRSGYSVKD